MRRRPSSLGRALGAAPGIRPAVGVGLFAAVVWFLVRPLIPRVVDAAHDLEVIDTRLVAVGFTLQVASLLCYSLMTRVALGNEHHRIGIGRLFRIQLVSRAVSSTVPGGVAAGPTVGYRLMTSSGLSGRATSAALASGSVLSAIVLNVLLWLALLASVPLDGFNVASLIAALVGVVSMLVVAGAFVAVVDENPIVERPVRWVAGRIGADADGVAGSIRIFGQQVERLGRDKRVVLKLVGWAAANWLLDAVSLGVFLRAFGVDVEPVALIVAFGVANVLAAIPVSPGGVGIVEWAYLSILVTFGAALAPATIAVTSYRVAQFLFPVLLGALASTTFAAETWLARRRTGPAM